MLVSLWPGPRQRPRERDLEAFAEQLQREIPALIGVGLSARPLHWGQRSLTYKVCGIPYQVSLGSFFQVNRFLLAPLLQLAIEGRSGRLAWDLYSGAGLFARALDFENVTAVESEGSSADDLKKNLEGRPHRVVRSSTLDFLRSQTRVQEKPDLILVDPPRAGLGKEICTLLAECSCPGNCVCFLRSCHPRQRFAVTVTVRIYSAGDEPGGPVSPNLPHGNGYFPQAELMCRHP